MLASLSDARATLFLVRLYLFFYWISFAIQLQLNIRKLAAKIVEIIVTRCKYKINRMTVADPS